MLQGSLDQDLLYKGLRLVLTALEYSTLAGAVGEGWIEQGRTHPEIFLKMIDYYWEHVGRILLPPPL
jgi:hypothetical protein